YVTIFMRGDVEGAAAFAAPRAKETILTLSKEEILAQIQVNLASRAAEILFLNVNLIGVTRDFQTATDLAVLYVGACGMDGTISSVRAQGGQFKVQKLEERVEALLQQQMKAVTQLFQEHRDAVISLAEALIE